MSTSIEKLAQLFKERNNPYTINVTVGEIIKENPLKIKWGDSVILENNSLILSRAITSQSLNIGDEVILIPDTDFKKFYVIDKVG